MPRQSKTSAVSSDNEYVVTAQQSRFHVDAVDAPTSKEIDIKDLNISVGNKQLLSNASLKLKENVHYVLIGRNGTGKSTLLRLLAEGAIPGVSQGLKVLLLGQSSLFSNDTHQMGASAVARSQSVLKHVLRSDHRREFALAEERLISEALDNTDDPMAVVRSFRKLKHDRVLRKYAETLEIANRRSGARGARARKEVIAIEKKLEVSQQQINETDEILAEAIQTETNEAVELLGELQASLAVSDSSNAENRASLILKGLGFKEDSISAPYTELSGGWRTRCILAGALFQEVDVLLLDECTNFLDLPAIMWLQSYIQNITNSTVVVITHDRDFADVVAHELLVLRFQNLEHFNGNVSSYERERQAYSKYMFKLKEAQDGKVKHMKATVASNIAAAKRTGDDKKLKQAASRKKKLEERTGLEVGLNGGRFKLSRDRPGFNNSLRADIEVPKMDPLVKIDLPSIPPELRFPGALISMDNITFKYPSKDIPTLREVSLTIHPGERMGIAGLNGSGKTTLIRLAVGQSGGAPLPPSSGTIERHSRLRVSCFSQHTVEELEKKGVELPSLTALQELLTTTEGQITEAEARAFLGSLGLSGYLASDVPIVSLSGGQKVRLALAKLFCPPPHLLILDEVTTHLDADTITALIRAFQQYQGALLIVTHDRFFMRCVVEGEPVDEEVEDNEDEDKDRRGVWSSPKPGVVYRLVNGRLKVLPGGMREYEGIADRLSKRHK